MKKNIKKIQFWGVFLVLVILTLSSISAFEFDNVKDYDVTTKTATITNALGLGAEIANVTLLTEHIVWVPTGYQKVAEFEIYNLDDVYTSPISKIESYNARDMEKITRTYDYKYWEVTGQIDVNDYETQCSALGNGSLGNCKEVVIGSHKEDVGEWIEFNNEGELPVGKIRISIWTNVYSGDYVEWVPTLFGVKIDEWAIFGVEEFVKHDLALTSACGGSNTQGVAVNFSATKNITAFNTTGGSTAFIHLSECYVYNLTARASACSGLQMIANGTYNLSGTEKCENFNATVQANPGDQYVFAGKHAGGACQYNGASPYPIERGDLNYSMGWHNGIGGTCASSSQLFSVSAIFYQNETTTPTVTTTLINPPDNLKTINTSIVFDSSAAAVGIANLTNTTLYVWNPDHSQFGINFTDITGGLSNSSNLSLSVLPLNNSYKWNVEWCAQNGIGEVDCSFASTNRTFNVTLVYENSQTYNTSTVETTIEGFAANVSYKSSTYTILTGRLFYNNTWYTGTKSGTGDEAILKTTITIPSLSSATHLNFTWEITGTSVEGSYKFNLTSYNQSVGILNMSIYGMPHTIPFINFTIYNETSLTAVNATIDLFMQYGITSLLKNFTYLDASGVNSSFGFAIDPPYKDYLVSGSISYSAPGFITRIYDIPQQTLTNTTTVIPLYLLSGSDSTSFIVYVRDSSYTSVAGAIVYIQKFDIGTGTWITTEVVETNDEGKSIGHFVTEDVYYRFLVYVNGVLQLTSTQTKIFCEASPCTITLTLPTSSEISIYRNVSDLTQVLSYNRTSSTFRFAYSDSDSGAGGGRLEVTQVFYGNSTRTLICNTSNAAVSAILTCDITAQNNGTYVGKGYITRSGSEFLVDSIMINKISDIISNIGLDGILWTVFLLIGIVMMGLYRPQIAILFSIAGVIFVSILGLAFIPIFSIVIIVIMGFFLLWEMNK